MGAMVGGIYAVGKLQEFKEWLLNLNRYKVFRLLGFVFQSRGLISGVRIFREFRSIIPTQDIQNLGIHFTAATDILNNKDVVYREDDGLLEAMRPLQIDAGFHLEVKEFFNRDPDHLPEEEFEQTRVAAVHPPVSFEEPEGQKA